MIDFSAFAPIYIYIYIYIHIYIYIYYLYIIWLLLVRIQIFIHINMSHSYLFFLPMAPNTKSNKYNRYHKCCYRIFIVFPCLPELYKQATIFSNWQFYLPLFWVVKNPTHVMMWTSPALCQRNAQFLLHLPIKA